MARIVPEPDRGLRQVVFIADRTQARRAQHQVPAGRGFEAQPASRQDPQKMPAREDQHILRDSAHTGYYAIRAGGHLARRFATRAAIA